MTDKKIPIDPKTFNALRRNDMYQELRKHFPEAAKGKSRSRQADLIESYAAAYKEWAQTHFNTTVQQEAQKLMEDSPTGRYLGKPNDPERSWEEERGPDAEEGPLFPHTDFSMLELRVLASLRAVDEELAGFSDDELYDAYGTRDLHRIMAAKIFGISADEVNSDQRMSVKHATHYERYGANPAKPPEGVEAEEWARFRERYHEVFPELTRLMRSDIERAKERLKHPVVMEHATNAAEHRAAKEPAGRRDEVEAALARLRMPQLSLIAEWKRAPAYNRHTKRRKAKLAKRINKFLPSGITISEAAQVV